MGETNLKKLNFRFKDILGTWELKKKKKLSKAHISLVPSSIFVVFFLR